MKPYGIGYNGHANVCDCARCAKSRARQVHMLLSEPQLPKAPSSVASTVFVRAHFRAQPGHMSRFPRTRLAVRKVLRRC